LCPDCFRRLDHTLRAVTATDAELVAVGARGTLLIGRRDAPEEVFGAPTCTPLPPPLDAGPLLTAASAAGGRVFAVGAAGTVLRWPSDGGCAIESLRGAPQGFLAAVHATSAEHAFAVGDRGLLVRVVPGRAPPVETIDTGIPESLLAVTVGRDVDGREVLWLVGASGAVFTGRFF
jgi:hypothetical protein